MADDVDVANDFIDSQVSRALGRIRQNTAGVLGPKTCVECDEDMLEERRKLGFKLCVQCAEESERRNALFANY